MPFKPGQSGNPGGRPKREWTWAGLLEAVGEEIEPKSGKSFKDLVTKRLWFDAVNGSLGAQKEILNRMDGLPIMRQEIGGIEGGIPIKITSYGHNDPLQLQTRTVEPTGDPRFIPSGTLPGTELAQKSEEDDTSSKPVDTVGSDV